MELWASMLFALAVSSDGFVVGMAYGIRKIRMPIQSLLIICLASASAVTVAMLCGKGLSFLLSPSVAPRLGAFTIVAIGGFFILQSFRQKLGEIEADGEEPILSFNVKPLGIIIQILKEPSTADFDRSGEIGLKEAFFLGLALAMDAFGAGIGIAMAGYNILFTALGVGMLKFILVSGGLILGKRVENEHWQYLSSVLTGLILIALGLSEII
ncbi:MAG: sporulation membrane protein YtaF [Syntrophomonadaceae bacterium]|nr:sporulation membrane protein YtaF [Syntrophomonadaceae bacterium]